MASDASWTLELETFNNSPPPGKAKLKPWWTYLRHFRLTVHLRHGIKNEIVDYISRNNLDALLGESSELLANEVFQRIIVQADMFMRVAGVPEGWSLTDYRDEYQCVPQALSASLEAHLIDGDRWHKDNQCLYYEDRMVVPEARLGGCLKWAHLISAHTGTNRSIDFFRKCLYSPLTCIELHSRMQSVADFCGCHDSKQSASGECGLISNLPIPCGANSLLYVDFIHGLPGFLPEKEGMKCLVSFGNTCMKEDTSSHLSGRGELHERLGLLP